MERSEEEQESRPHPDDFHKFVPWACHQYQMNANVFITKIYQPTLRQGKWFLEMNNCQKPLNLSQPDEYVSVTLTDKAKKIKSKAKLTASRHDLGSEQEKEEKTDSVLVPLLTDQKIVKMTAIYDIFDNLIEIKFENNTYIPRLLFKIIGLIIQFQMYITKISINGGIDMYTVYEINKFLTASNITEICLDGSYLKEANYDILLETSSALRHLSLSRCKIDDNIIKNITTKLTFPSPASLTLIILNLSSNRITDLGAKYLAEAIRSNRHLSYLNLADNRLTDTGLGCILDCLAEFPLSSEELLAARSRHMLYLKEKNVLIERMIRELKAGEFDRRAAKRKSIRPVTTTSKRSKVEKEPSLGDAKSLVNMDLMYYDRALNMVENTLGEFNDPYSSLNTHDKDGVMYCKGCNTLCYLNVAYNNLTYLSLKKILRVLIFQKYLDRKPRGLINVCVEGNYMPEVCKELTQIDDILEMGLMVHNRRLSLASKKRLPSKYTPR